MNKYLIIGGIIIVFIGTLALCAPLIAPYDPLVFQDLPHEFAPPSSQHILGQGERGGDIFSYLVYGARLSLIVAIITTFITCFTGLILGSLSAYFGSWVDTLIMRIVDILLAFPGFLFAICIAAFFTPSIANVILALSVTGWTSYARLVRGQILSVKEKEYVQSARALGLSHVRIILKHIWPNIFAPLLVQASFGMASVIIAESSLSFLGVGIGEASSWGLMLDEARGHILNLSRSHLLFPPLIAIMTTVLGFNFLGDGLIQKLDPTFRGRKYVI